MAPFFIMSRNIGGTAWTSHGATRSGSRRRPLVTRGGK